MTGHATAADERRPHSGWRAGRGRVPDSKASQEALSSGAVPLVHLMASSLRVDRSLATAVRFAARHAAGPAGEELERLEWGVRIRRFATVEDGLTALANRVGAFEPDLKRALLTLMGAEAEATREGLERRLDRAYDIVLRAEERRRERLSSTVERPITTLFGIGVVLPLVMASLFPMIQMAAPGFGPVPLAFILLVAIPTVTYLAAAHIVGRNTLGTPFGGSFKRPALASALAPPVAGGAAAALLFLGGPSAPLPLPLGVALAASAAGGFAGIWLRRVARALESEQTAFASELPDLLHTAGSRMAAGRSAEQAMLDAVEAAPSAALARRLRGVLFDVIIGRRSLEQAIDRDKDIQSQDRVYPALRLLAIAAARDSANAGRVVLHLAEFERLRQEAVESVRTRVRSIVDTARTTVTVFAPLILGITAGMFGLLARVSVTPFLGASISQSAIDSGAFAALIAIYLCTQVALVDWFAVRMTSSAPASALGKYLAQDVPLASGLFAAAFVGASTVL